MIVADSSSLIAFWEGESGPDVEIVDRALEEKTLVMVPPVIAEILSDPELPEAFREKILSLPALPILEGYWERVGELRASIISRGRRAKIGDSLIARVCLDHEALLIERDSDYQVFSDVAGLKLAIPRSS
jgi:predicted nucleic acid-binding protein